MTISLENNKIDLLDHGYVRLIDHMGSDLSIVRSARVSHNADWRTGEDDGKDAKLIHYLWKHRHTTPFESVAITFEIQAPIFIFRQWHRHRTQSYNEVSARYTELPELYYIPRPEHIGVQDSKNKQARNNTPLQQHEIDKKEFEIDFYIRNCENAFRAYHELLAREWPRELARCVLPLSTYSRMFATANLRNWFHFCELRTHKHAQWEIREYAFTILYFLRDLFPIATTAFDEEIEKDA